MLVALLAGGCAPRARPGVAVSAAPGIVPGAGASAATGVRAGASAATGVRAVAVATAPVQLLPDTTAVVLSIAGIDALLATQNGSLMKPTALFTELDELIVDEQPSLLVIDTLGRTFGGDENQRNHAQQFVGLLQGLCVKHDLTILVLAHPSLSGLHSGSGTLPNCRQDGPARLNLTRTAC